MKSVALATGVILAVLAAGGTGAARPAKTVAGNLETEFGVRFSPRALSEERPTPIAPSWWWTVRTLDGAHPAALRKFRVRSDEHVKFPLDGLPICKLRGS
ncbi:MAG TPA: hypothetical protein VGV34_06750, partial [Solirubrobacterales bacterium]|nr:hypothetical protein [Solirubrobacterales bacterium]